MHLYEIADDYRNILSLMDESDLSDAEASEAIANALTQVGGEFEEKAVSVVRVITNHQSDIDAIDAEIARLSARKKPMIGRREWLEGYLLHNMQMTGISEIKCPAFTIRLLKNPPAVQVDDDAAIPAEYLRAPQPQKATPDKVAIKKALLAGISVAGCRLERKSKVEIK